MTRPFIPQFGLTLLTVAAVGGMFAAAVQLGFTAQPLAFLPGVVAIAAVAAVVLLFACAGHQGALVAYLVALAFVNDALFRVREPGDTSLDWQNALKFLLWGGGACIGICRLHAVGRLYTRPTVVIVLCYLVIALISAVYSAAPVYTFATAFGMLSLLLAAGALAELPEATLLLTFALSLAFFVVAGWAVYFVIPEMGRSPFITADGSIIERICGLAGQANALGCVLAVFLSIVFLMWYLGHFGPLVTGPLAALGIFTLLAADSRTALLAWIAGVAAVLARRSLFVWGSALLAGTLGVLLVAGVPLRVLAGMTGNLARSGDPSEMFTLTGRTEIWAFVWDRIVVQPWFGYGYNSAKFILPQFLGLPGLQVDEAHNTWLQNLLGTGIVGTVPLVLLIVVQLVMYVRNPDPFRDMFLFIILVWGVTVAGAYGSTPTIMTLAVCMSLVRPTPADRAGMAPQLPPPRPAPTPPPLPGQLPARLPARLPG